MWKGIVAVISMAAREVDPARGDGVEHQLAIAGGFDFKLPPEIWDLRYDAKIPLA